MEGSQQTPTDFEKQSLRAVCFPTFSVIGVLLVRFSLHRRFTVYYETWPFYGKALVRWCKVSPRVLEKIFSTMLRVTIKRVADSDASRGSPHRNIEAMKLVVDILESLRCEMTQTRWLALLARVIGEEPALAYYQRRFPAVEIWPSIIAAAVCKDQLAEDEQFVVAWEPDWPASWRGHIDAQLRLLDARTFPWPRWYSFLASRSTAFWWTLRTVGNSIASLVRHGLPRSSEHEPVPVVIEFIEYARMKGESVDTNYFEDGRNLRRQDILYFLTPGQAKLLQRDGKDVDEMLSKAKSDGFRVVELSSLRYSWSTGRFALGLILRSLPGFLFAAPCLARTFSYAIDDYLTQASLFDSYRPRNYLHTNTPNGSTGLRFDSAIVTGLCRKHNSRSVGYQNRCIYDSVYEDCFDCYDLFLAWGETWLDVLGPGREFIDRVAVVGCQNNDGVSETDNAVSRASSVRSVAVFPSDLGGNLYPKTSTLNLLETCIDLASTYPDWYFRIKMKDPEMVDVLLSDPEFTRLCASVASNFEFLRLARHDCAATIAESDIVIGAAWTTPASDALLQGKRVIFYDEFGAGGTAFADFPEMVARSCIELKRIFRIATNDYQSYALANRAVLARLDPFRDGGAKRRILDLLLSDAPTSQREFPIVELDSQSESLMRDRLRLEKVG